MLNEMVYAKEAPSGPWCRALKYPETLFLLFISSAEIQTAVLLLWSEIWSRTWVKEPKLGLSAFLTLSSTYFYKSAGKSNWMRYSVQRGDFQEEKWTDFKPSKLYVNVTECSCFLTDIRNKMHYVYPMHHRHFCRCWQTSADLKGLYIQYGFTIWASTDDSCKTLP